MAELKLGDKVVANIDDLRKYYDCSQIFYCVNDGTLQKWLNDSGYSKEAEAIELLYKQNGEYLSISDINIAIKLYQILHSTDKIPLMIDDKIIADIKGLRENYSCGNILEYFKSGNLALWLEQNGYGDELKAIQLLPKDLTDLAIDRNLYKILHNLNEIPFLVGGNNIANIDDLRKYYGFIDIFEYFKSGELAQWLEKNGYSDETNAIKSLSKDLNVGQIHLKLYEILNGADKTPPFLKEYFEAFGKWTQKQDELTILLDKALPLYESLEKNNFIESEVEKKERKSLDSEISEVEYIERELYGDCESLLDKLQQNEGSVSEVWNSVKLNFKLIALSLATSAENTMKRSQMTTIGAKMLSKQIEGLSKEKRNMPLKVLLKKAKIHSPR